MVFLGPNKEARLAVLYRIVDSLVSLTLCLTGQAGRASWSVCSQLLANPAAGCLEQVSLFWGGVHQQNGGSDSPRGSLGESKKMKGDPFLTLDISQHTCIAHYILHYIVCNV